MKRFLRFTAMAAVLVASATFASADTIQISSFGTGDSAMGNNNTSVAYNGFIAQANPPYPANPSSFLSTNPAASTFNIGTGGGVWYRDLHTPVVVRVLRPVEGDGVGGSQGGVDGDL